jgi:hypothetical protein
MARGQRDSNREAFWRGVLGKFRDSGLNIRDFCRRAKVTEASFYAWRRTLHQREAELARQPSARTRQARPVQRQSSQPTFVPLVVRDEHAPDATTGVSIELGHGSRTRVLRVPATIPPERLAELIRAIESVPVAPESRP